MSITFPIIVFLLVITAVSAFVYFQGVVKKKSPIEEAYSLVYEEITGGLIYGINYTSPFVRHSIYDGLIVIGWLNTKLNIDIANITNAEIIKGVFGSGIRYKVKGIPTISDVTIWFRSKNSVPSALNRVGINVSAT